jgi:DNA-binding LacI/PurR family transcriptional regulator
MRQPRRRSSRRSKTATRMRDDAVPGYAEPMKGKTTSFDIAYMAGVSQSTVSRALRGSPLVNRETRQRIQSIAKQLNYTLDKNASNLRTQRSATLALLLFEDKTTDDSLINPFFLSMLGSITRACARQGYDLLISFQQLSNDWHADYRDSHKADGLILLGYGDYLISRPKLETLAAQGTHFVCWGATVDGQPGVSIGCDNVHGGRLATEHLLAQGRRRIAFLGNATDHFPEFHDRYLGYCEAMDAAGVAIDPALQVDVIDSTEQDGYSGLQQLLERGGSFDAVFAASDLIAIGAMHALAAAGLRVPDEIAVVGFDDIPTARFANPSLTTVVQDTKLAGQMLVDAVVRMIAGETIANERLPARLVIRRSCGAAVASSTPRAVAAEPA